MFPEITELEINIEPEAVEREPIGMSYLYDFQKGDFVLQNGRLVEVHGIDSLRVWVEKVLRTEYGRFRIYKEVEYGVILEDLIGSNYPRDFVEAEIEREVTTALLRHEHIISVENWDFERDGSTMRVWFTVVTPTDTFDMGVTI